MYTYYVKITKEENCYLVTFPATLITKGEKLPAAEYKSEYKVGGQV